MAPSGSTRAVVVALLANLGIAITKFMAWLLTGASSLLAEAVHSVADTSNQALLLIGGHRAAREPTP
ncbi:MAG TPA: cation transporter, partial [Jiangellaceae bacterium]|nr:cation transporter [Jiangellaceae bacterium]